MDCIFCKIANKELPAKIVFADENFVAFDDINPKAPVHILIVPRRHIFSVDHLEREDKELIGEMILTAQKEKSHRADPLLSPEMNLVFSKVLQSWKRRKNTLN